MNQVWESEDDDLDVAEIFHESNYAIQYYLERDASDFSEKKVASLVREDRRARAIVRTEFI